MQPMHDAPIDLRSDTVTRPSAAMREAIARAEVGDDAYGEDPTVAALESRTAEMLGHEAALFFPTGTMANQAAIGSFAGPGQAVLCEQTSHVFSLESGGMAALWGAQPHPVAGEAGVIRPEQIEEALDFSVGENVPRPVLLCLENTHNRAGGTLWPFDTFRAVVETARRAGLGVHLDGARLWNASVATGIEAARFASLCDTVSVCLSKGLGAPAGSLVAGTKERIATLRRLRRRLGGGMRQAGILAAAGLYALEHNIERLAEDHRRARLLADALAALPALRVEPPPTNILIVHVEGGTARSLVGRLRELGVLANAMGDRAIRLVTHLEIDDEACRRAAQVFAEALKGPERKPGT